MTGMTEGSRQMSSWNFRKAVVAREDMPEEHRLKQSLGWPHLVALGVGAIVGTGIFTLIGVGAGKAGPAVILSLRHRRHDLRLRRARLCRGRDDDPGLGHRLHLQLRRVRRADRLDGRLALILEYTLVVSAVAVGWSGYATGFLNSVGVGLPDALMPGARAGRRGQPAGDLHHLGRRRPADRRHARERHGQRHPGRCIKLVALALFVAVALPVFDAGHFHPFMPFGFPRSGRRRAARSG